MLEVPDVLLHQMKVRYQNYHYRMGKEPQKAIDCLVKAATCAAECGQEFEVGKHNQQAGMIAKSMKTEEYFKMAADFFEQAFNAYKDNGDMVTAQTAGKQAADIIAKFEKKETKPNLESLLLSQILNQK